MMGVVGSGEVKEEQQQKVVVLVVVVERKCFDR